MGVPAIQIVGEHGACTVTPFVAGHYDWPDHDLTGYGVSITASGWWDFATLSWHDTQTNAQGVVISETDYSETITLSRGVTRWDDGWNGAYGNASFCDGRLWIDSPLEEFPLTTEISNCRITFHRKYLYSPYPLYDKATGSIHANSNGEIITGLLR